MPTGSANAAKTHCPQGHEYDEANTWRGPGGARQCRACNRDKARALRAAKKIPYSVWQRREKHLWTKYGLTWAQYEKMYDEQGGVCAICDGLTPPSRSQARAARSVDALVIDHDHETGAVRGLLCESCNVALGRVNDNQETLCRMIEYLRQEPRYSGRLRPTSASHVEQDGLWDLSG